VFDQEDYIKLQKLFGEKLRIRPPLQLPFKLFLIYSLVSEWEVKNLWKKPMKSMNENQWNSNFEFWKIQNVQDVQNFEILKFWILKFWQFWNFEILKIFKILNFEINEITISSEIDIVSIYARSNNSVIGPPSNHFLSIIVWLLSSQI